MELIRRACQQVRCPGVHAAHAGSADPQTDRYWRAVRGLRPDAPGTRRPRPPRGTAPAGRNSAHGGREHCPQSCDRHLRDTGPAARSGCCPRRVRAAPHGSGYCRFQDPAAHMTSEPCLLRGPANGTGHPVINQSSRHYAGLVALDSRSRPTRASCDSNISAANDFPGSLTGVNNHRHGATPGSVQPLQIPPGGTSGHTRH